MSHGQLGASAKLIAVGTVIHQMATMIGLRRTWSAAQAPGM